MIVENWKYDVHAKKDCVSGDKHFFVTLFFNTHFSKTTASQQIIFFNRKLSTIVILKACKFKVNLWTLCFVPYKKYPNPSLNNEIKLLDKCCKLVWVVTGAEGCVECGMSWLSAMLPLSKSTPSVAL